MNTYVELRNKNTQELYIIPNGVDITIKELTTGLSVCDSYVADLLQVRQSDQHRGCYYTQMLFVYNPINSERTVVGFITNIGVLS